MCIILPACYNINATTEIEREATKKKWSIKPWIRESEETSELSSIRVQHAQVYWSGKTVMLLFAMLCYLWGWESKHFFRLFVVQLVLDRKKMISNVACECDVGLSSKSEQFTAFFSLSFSLALTLVCSYLYGLLPCSKFNMYVV